MLNIAGSGMMGIMSAACYSYHKTPLYMQKQIVSATDIVSFYNSAVNHRRFVNMMNFGMPESFSYGQHKVLACAVKCSDLIASET